jgi:tRNA A-37 threonylcarbamoyl transferase component Bud32
MIPRLANDCRRQANRDLTDIHGRKPAPGYSGSVAEARVVAGRYRLTRQLGRGGMGAVWLGEDELAGRQVAVKELRAPDGVTDAEREVFRKRALQEARSAARLAHRNAVTLYDVIPASSADDAVYLIMEYVDGATLAQVIERDGPLSEPRTAEIALPLLSILEAAHALGIVHRDIKPANIMISADGRVKLTGFGIAHVVGGTRLTGSGVIGTPAYLAPEQLQGMAVTPAVDLWSLGVTLYNAVAGRNPFDRDTTAATFHAILMAELPAPACAPPPAAEMEHGFPAPLLGNWTGTLADNTGLEGPQATHLTLTGGLVNSVVGTADYPTVGCRYDLVLISSQQTGIEVYEEIKSGPCIPEYLMLVPVITGIAESVYSSQPSGQQPDFYGVLSKG